MGRAGGEGSAEFVGEVEALGEEGEAGVELVGVGAILVGMGAEPAVAVGEVGEVLGGHLAECGGDSGAEVDAVVVEVGEGEGSEFQWYWKSAVSIHTSVRLKRTIFCAPSGVLPKRIGKPTPACM